jgi:hypothetical protein
MSQTSILSPVLGMLCLAFAVWIWMFITRFRFIGANKIDPKELATPEQIYRTLPAFAANPGYNFRNLFEMPVLFYTLCFYLFMMQQVDSTHVTCAWVFVAFRVLHSLIQCSYNNVNHRFGIYALSSIALWVMLVRAVLA